MKFVENVKGTYDGYHPANGRDFVIETDLDVQVVGDEESAIATGADNLVEFGTDTIVDDKGGEVAGAVFSRKGENFDRMVINTSDEAAHEFGHFLGGADMYKSSSDKFCWTCLMGLGNKIEEGDMQNLFNNEKSVPTDIGHPPQYITLRPNKPILASEGTTLSEKRGSRILSSYTPTLETRRSSGSDVYRWVKQGKK